MQEFDRNILSSRTTYLFQDGTKAHVPLKIFRYRTCRNMTNLKEELKRATSSNPTVFAPTKKMLDDGNELTPKIVKSPLPEINIFLKAAWPHLKNDPYASRFLSNFAWRRGSVPINSWPPINRKLKSAMIGELLKRSRKAHESNGEDYHLTSFTDRADSQKMWDDYADQGRGVCLEFEALDQSPGSVKTALSLREFDIFFGSVRYTEDQAEVSETDLLAHYCNLPFLQPLTQKENIEKLGDFDGLHPEELIGKLFMLKVLNAAFGEGRDKKFFSEFFLTKHVDYAYEREWRTLSRNHGFYTPISGYRLKSIWLGKNTTDEDKAEIIKCVKKTEVAIMHVVI